MHVFSRFGSVAASVALLTAMAATPAAALPAATATSAFVPVYASTGFAEVTSSTGIKLDLDVDVSFPQGPTAADCDDGPEPDGVDLDVQKVGAALKEQHYEFFYLECQYVVDNTDGSITVTVPRQKFGSGEDDSITFAASGQPATVANACGRSTSEPASESGAISVHTGSTSKWGSLDGAPDFTDAALGRDGRSYPCHRQGYRPPCNRTTYFYSLRRYPEKYAEEDLGNYQPYQNEPEQGIFLKPTTLQANDSGERASDMYSLKHDPATVTTVTDGHGRSQRKVTINGQGTLATGSETFVTTHTHKRVTDARKCTTAAGGTGKIDALTWSSAKRVGKQRLTFHNSFLTGANLGPHKGAFALLEFLPLKH